MAEFVYRNNDFYILKAEDYNDNVKNQSAGLEDFTEDTAADVTVNERQYDASGNRTLLVNSAKNNQKHFEDVQGASLSSDYDTEFNNITVTNASELENAFSNLVKHTLNVITVTGIFTITNKILLIDRRCQVKIVFSDGYTVTFDGTYFRLKNGSSIEFDTSSNTAKSINKIGANSYLIISEGFTNIIFTMDLSQASGTWNMDDQISTEAAEYYIYNGGICNVQFNSGSINSSHSITALTGGLLYNKGIVQFQTTNDGSSDNFYKSIYDDVYNSSGKMDGDYEYGNYNDGTSDHRRYFSIII